MSSPKQEEQLKWFEQELAKARSTPFLAVVAHHPLYSNGMHGDNPTLIAQWDSLLRHHYVDLYLSGHDHDLQHIQLQGHPTFFVISGEGGARVVKWCSAALRSAIPAAGREKIRTSILPPENMPVRVRAPVRSAASR